MGFAAGMSVGLDAGSNIKKGFKARKRDKELASLGEEYDTVEGKGLRVTKRDTGEESSVVIDPSSGADMDAIREQYTNAGYMVDTTDDAYGARSGQGADAGGAYASEAAAQGASRKANYGLTKKRAAVYEKHGDSEMAQGLRRDAQSMRLQDQEMDMRQAGESRAAKEYDYLQGERARLRGMEQAAQAYETGDWATLSDVATNVWGDKYRYDISPDGEVVTVLDKETGNAIKQMPMPSREKFMGALIKSKAENWLPMMNHERQVGRDQVADDQWQKGYALNQEELGLKAFEAGSQHDYRKGMLANDGARVQAARDQTRMGTPFETADGFYTPAMVNGQVSYERAMGPDGQPLRKPPKPMDDKVRLEIRDMAISEASRVKGFAKLPPDAQAKLVQNAEAQIMNAMRPQAPTGGQPPAAGGDWRAGMDQAFGAGAPQAPAQPPQGRPGTGLSPMNDMDRTRQRNTLQQQIVQLSAVAKQLPEGDPQRQAVVQRLQQLGAEYAAAVNQ